MPNSLRFLGLELSGAKSHKTALAVIDYFAKEKKIFVTHIYDRLPHKSGRMSATSRGLSSDQHLISTLRGLASEETTLATHVPLQLPPCIECKIKNCPMPANCKVSSVRWMRKLSGKHARRRNPAIKIKEITPYTQRPVELWMKFQIQPELPPNFRFEIDDALGGNKAPLTARIWFLKRHLKFLRLIEAWPKLTLAKIVQKFHLEVSLLSQYRDLETGAVAREHLLDAMVNYYNIFIYDRDIDKLAQSLQAFDAFICSFTALLYELGQCAAIPEGFPKQAGWIQFPADS